MTQAENKEQSFSQKVAISIGVTILFLTIVLLAYFAIEVLFNLFAAVLLAVFFRGLGDIVSKYTRIPEGYAVLLGCLLLIVFFSFGFHLLAPEVAVQIKALQDSFPDVLDTARNRISGNRWGSLILEQIPSWGQIYNWYGSGNFLARVGGVFSTTVGVAGNIVIIFLMALYLASNPQIYRKGLIKLFPVSKRERIGEVISETGQTLRWWIVGKIVSMLIIGVLTTIGLSVIGVPLALTLGILAALLAFVPNFGPIVAVIPAVLFALVESPAKALYVLVLYLGIQLVESYLITPLIERKTVSLPPVLTIFFQIFLGVLVGGIGLILATPLLVIIIVIVKMLYIEDILEYSDVNRPGDENSPDP